MFDILQKINARPRPYEFYTAEKLWNDEHISKKMLEYHLNPEAEPASRNKAFIDKSTDWMIRHFNINQNTKVADFGCGPGLYTTAFAKAGATVMGLDFSRRSIEYAKGQALVNNLKIQYLLQNYLDYEPSEKFDLITLIYCDFCPLSPTQRSQLLNIFHQCLKDDGRLLLDVSTVQMFNRKVETATCQHLLLDGFWAEEDYYGFLNTFKYEKDKVSLDKYMIIEKTKTWEVYNWLQHYDKQSITEELEQNGFQVQAYFSDAAGKPFAEDSLEMAVDVRKKF